MLTPSFSLYRFVLSRTSGAEYFCPLSPRTARLTKARPAQAVTAASGRSAAVPRRYGPGFMLRYQAIISWYHPNQCFMISWRVPSRRRRASAIIGRRFAAAERLFGKNSRSHHKGATGRVRTGDQLLPILCHCQLGQVVISRARQPPRPDSMVKF